MKVKDADRETKKDKHRAGFFKKEGTPEGASLVTKAVPCAVATREAPAKITFTSKPITASVTVAPLCP